MGALTSRIGGLATTVLVLGLLGAWFMLQRGEARRNLSEPLEAIGLTVVAVVRLLRSTPTDG